MSDKVIKPTVIALGYFDSVHRGHQRVIEVARNYAKEHGLTLTVFTFKGNLKAMLNADSDKMVYLPKEREKILKDLGADDVYFAPVDFSFLSLGKKSFLTKINKKFDIKCYVSGQDYKFGKFGLGTVEDLRAYSKEKGQDYIVVDTLNADDGKISTTRIKKLLTSGDVKKVNELLGREYSVTGTVYKDRMIGGALGFPTLNMRLDKEKFRLQDGVYSGDIDIDGKNYRAIINYGDRPTFNLVTKLIEAHVIDYDGDLYDRVLTVNFKARIRDIKKFVDADTLKSQLAIDLAEVKAGKYD